MATFDKDDMLNETKGEYSNPNWGNSVTYFGIFMPKEIYEAFRDEFVKKRDEETESLKTKSRKATAIKNSLLANNTDNYLGHLLPEVITFVKLYLDSISPFCVIFINSTLSE